MICRELFILVRANSPRAHVRFRAGNRGFAAPDQGMRIPERNGFLRRVPIPWLGLRLMPAPCRDENVIVLELIPLEDDCHGVGRLGFAILYEPGQPKPLRPLCVYNFVARLSGDANRLTDNEVELDRLDEKLPTPAIDSIEGRRQERRRALMDVRIMSVDNWLA